MNKGNLLLLTLFFMGLVLIVSFASWFLANQKYPLTTPEKSKGTEDEVAPWKTYQNDEYGFEFKYPTYFNPGQADKNQISFSYGDQSDRIVINILAGSLDGKKYTNESGAFSFSYSEKDKKWIPNEFPDTPEAFAPIQYKVNDTMFYLVKTGDGGSVWQIVWLENPEKKFVVNITHLWNATYTECSPSCPEEKPLSNENTIKEILSTFKFTK